MYQLKTLLTSFFGRECKKVHNGLVGCAEQFSETASTLCATMQTPQKK